MGSDIAGLPAVFVDLFESGGSLLVGGPTYHLPLRSKVIPLRLPCAETDFSVVLLTAILTLSSVVAGQDRGADRYPGFASQQRPVQQRPVQRAYQPPPAAQLYQPAKVLAVVGSEQILAGEIYAQINLLLAPQMDKIPAEVFEKNRERVVKEFQAQREMLVKQYLRKVIDDKILYVAYKKFEIPADKQKEAEEQMRQKAPKAFQNSLKEMREKLEGASKERVEKLKRQQPILATLALMMQDNDLHSIADLDVHLKNFGSSVAQQTRIFLEQGLGKQYLGSKVNRNAEVTHQEMLDYYYKHPAEFQVKAKARWEQLMISSSRVPKSEEAQRLIAEMGNQVVFGASFAAVAKRSSHGSTASKGGAWDWTTEGSLRSKELDAAIFQLPVDRLSQIIRDDRGLHIIRVVERTEPGKIDFKVAQVEIRADLKSQKLNEDFQRVLKEVKEQIKPVEIYLD